MAAHKNLSVAFPWSLSHYIPLNGFHPLYRALFDHAPFNIEFHAWDNVKLHDRLTRDIEMCAILLQAANEEKKRVKNLGNRSFAKAYQEYFWPPNRILTTALAGDVEFHHTAPYPSLKRPFVFHCESIDLIFFPFTQQGSGEFKNHEELREYYRGIFESPLCLGIFSHIPETLVSLSRFFSSEKIDKKLFSSRIGLSLKAIGHPVAPGKTLSSRAIFLFINSANQNPANFFRRGGHIVLRFWQKFITGGRDGQLILRCAKPSDEDLLEYGVDVSFLKIETGRSILWAEDYLANHEMNALVASAHFFLLPSLSLHSVSIMQAMMLGTIPVVTDIVGTSVYLEDDIQGIVLSGVRAAIWQTNPNARTLSDRYCRASVMDDALVFQMTSRIFSILDTSGAYQDMRNRMMEHARQNFSGEAFGRDFWNVVFELHEKHKQSASTTGPMRNELACSLHDCVLQGDGWARVFESTTQPVRRIYTSLGSVYELGGAFIYVKGNLPSVAVNDWSVFARYFSPEPPETAFATRLENLGGKYLSPEGKLDERVNRKLIVFISRLLMPYPELHSVAASMLKRIRRYRKFLAYKMNRSKREPDIELVYSAVHGYNVIRYFHKYYALLQSDGAFTPKKVKAGGYSSLFCGNTAEKVLSQIVNAANGKKQQVSCHNSIDPELVVEGFLGFNIIRRGDKFHAILQSDGTFEYAKISSKGYRVFFSASSLSDVKDMIVMHVSPQKG